MEKVDEEYGKVLKEFYAMYRSLQKQYNLHMRSRVGTREAVIAIYQRDSAIRSNCICRIKEENEIDCYRKATEVLKAYSKEKVA